MFNRGVDELLKNLPEFRGLDSATARRMLSYAYAETLDFRAVQGVVEIGEVATQLGRLSTALQLYAILRPGVDRETQRACAFVAAEALSLIDDLLGNQSSPNASVLGKYRRIESGLLYLIAGYDANAAVMARGVTSPLISETEDPSERVVTAAVARGVRSLKGLLMLRPEDVPELLSNESASQLDAVVRAELWRRLSLASDNHLRWLRLDESTDMEDPRALVDQLLGALLAEQAGAYADIAHLARLLRLVVNETSQRALRNVRAPDHADEWLLYQRARAAERPLLWPAAADYATSCLPGPSQHGAVAVPTGAGKSGVAELAIAQAAHGGWVLYLAPTNALVGQVQRDLRQALRSTDVTVRGFVGGAEFVGSVEEGITGVGPGQVLVMTPEKCSLALRQAPQPFAGLALCIVDECHELGAHGSRGVLAELVVAYILSLAPDVRVLLLSALMANPENLAGWLQTATGRQAVPIREPWRPTRTLRAVVGFVEASVEHAAEEAEGYLDEHPTTKTRKFDAPLFILAGLKGAWDQDEPLDYALFGTSVSARLTLGREPGDLGSYKVARGSYVNPTVAKLAAKLALESHRVLAFIPGNRHWSFSVAWEVDLRQLDRTPLPGEATAQLDLAEAELGVASQVRELLLRGVGVHTSATLQTERRASEIAFEQGSIRVLCATGGLAQGLNLPATAVIIGGTEIGHDQSATAGQLAERAATQLLNAIGRSGRPAVASRSLAIVIPSHAVAFRGPDLATDARAEVPFLASEDAAVSVTSRLDRLIDRALRPDDDTGAMTTEELTAFTVLPLSGASEVIRRTYGAWLRNVDSEGSAQAIAGALIGLGQRFLAGRPAWLAEAAYLGGLTVQQTMALHDAYRATRTDSSPSVPRLWVQAALVAASQMPTQLISEIVDEHSVSSTRLQHLYDEDSQRRQASWTTLKDVADAWMDGETYEKLGAIAVGEQAVGDARRHAQAPLPKVIRVVDQAFVFGLTRLIGGLVALYEQGRVAEPENWDLSDVERHTLELAPLAIRSGCGSHGALAWYRFGVPYRRLAHIFATQFPLPLDAGDTAVRAFVLAAREQWLEDGTDTDWELSDRDRAAIRAWRGQRITL